MTNRGFIFSLVFTLYFFGGIAQKKKEVKKYGIKTVTTTKTVGTTTIRDEKLSYNFFGLLTEEIKYDEEGNLAKLTVYKYDAEGQLIEELVYNAKNVLVEKRKIKYNTLSQKIEEKMEDASGKQIKKISYVYNSKGLKIEKKTYDKDNKLLFIKKTSYSYK